jgi:hypothetical protein
LDYHLVPSSLDSSRIIEIHVQISWAAVTDVDVSEAVV